jgi:hypothetical protein
VSELGRGRRGKPLPRDHAVDAHLDRLPRAFGDHPRRQVVLGREIQRLPLAEGVGGDLRSGR